MSLLRPGSYLALSSLAAAVVVYHAFSTREQ
jgi:hypothetical protein